MRHREGRRRGRASRAREDAWRWVLLLALMAGALCGGCGGEGSGGRTETPGGTEASGKSTQPEDVGVITTVQLRAELASGDPPVLLDVRTPGEHAQGRIEGAVLIPIHEVDRRMEELEPYRGERIVVYCEAGVRSREVARRLVARGFPDVVDYRAGMREWRR